MNNKLRVALQDYHTHLREFLQICGREYPKVRQNDDLEDIIVCSEDLAIFVRALLKEKK